MIKESESMKLSESNEISDNKVDQKSTDPSSIKSKD